MKIIVAGSTGLVGSALTTVFERAGYEVIGINRSVLDLLDLATTKKFITANRPSLVIDAAAKVGGIGANNTLPVEFLSDNLRIQSHLMEAAHAASVEKFVFLGSSCIYPRNCPQPIKEEYILSEAQIIDQIIELREKNEMKVNYIKEKVSQICDEFGANGFGLVEVDSAPIFYGEDEDELRQIEYLGRKQLYVDVYSSDTNSNLGDFKVSYESLPGQILDELVEILLNH